MSFEEAVEFVRSTDWDIWNRLMEEMRETERRRAIACAASINIGDLVVTNEDDPRDRREGRVIRKARGLLTLDIPSEKGGWHERIRVPATTVRRCA